MNNIIFTYADIFDQDERNEILRHGEESGFCYPRDIIEDVVLDGLETIPANGEPATVEFILNRFLSEYNSGYAAHHSKQHIQVTLVRCRLNPNCILITQYSEIQNVAVNPNIETCWREPALSEYPDEAVPMREMELLSGQYHFVVDYLV